jgi:hypothetical protein
VPLRIGASQLEFEPRGQECSVTETKVEPLQCACELPGAVDRELTRILLDQRSQLTQRRRLVERLVELLRSEKTARLAEMRLDRAEHLADLGIGVMLRPSARC